MEKLHFAIILAIIIGVSGCVQAEKNQQIVQNTTPEENKSAPSPITKNVSEGPVQTASTPTLANEMYIAPGSSPSITDYYGTMHIAYQRFTGASEDIYIATYNGEKVGTPLAISASGLNDISPSITATPGKLYAFYTKTATSGEQNSNIYYKYYEKQWSGEYKANDFYEIWYPHNQSAVFYDGKVLLFWTRGRPGELGKIGTQYFDGSAWLDGIKVSAEIVNEKNPKVAIVNNKIHMIYEGYAGNSESNEIYFRSYDGIEWSGAEKLSGSVSGAFKGSGSIIYYKDKIYALWFVDSAIYLSTKEGTKWSEPVKLTKDDAVYQEPSIAEYNGKLYVGYTKIAKAGQPFVYLAELQGIN